MGLNDIDVFEYHEAFAGQVLANLNAIDSDEVFTFSFVFFFCFVVFWCVDSQKSQSLKRKINLFKMENSGAKRNLERIRSGVLICPN